MIKKEDLEEPEEALILKNIQSHFENKQIYTQCGVVLLSLNPFSEIKIYEKSAMQAYCKNYGSVEPHVYSVAENAIQNLSINGNQTIIISGESGSGKTENAKHLLKYLIWRCEGGRKLESLLLASHFILECFGNAKTQINENSSRFGKYLTLYFEKENIIGGKIEEFLLEKSRITHQSKNDKNFHIFYLIAAGMNLCIQNDYIKHKVTEDDLSKFKKLESIFLQNDFMSFEKLKQQILSILELGSLKFMQTENSLEILNEQILNKVCENFNLKFDKIKYLFLKNILNIKNEKVERNNSIEQALNIRDTFARHLYHKVFQSVIHSINEKLGSKSESFISILDIYGFEVFEENGFDQFCINWANERIQNEFVKRMFVERQNFYKSEEVSFPNISFSSNEEVIELLEGNLGIADLIEEDSLNPCGSTTSLLVKINKFNKGRSKLLPTTTPNSIKIDHFAYPVEYSLDNFIEKNMENYKNFELTNENNEYIPNKESSNRINFSDIQERDLMHEFISTSEKIKMFDKPSTNESMHEFISTSEKIKMFDKPSTNESTHESMHELSSIKKDNNKNKTIIKSFIESMDNLFKIINNTEIHYIRCIRPNKFKEPWKFDPSYVSKQLCTSGVKEITELSKLIYPHVILKSVFFKRYRMLTLAPDSFVEGKNYVFLKNEKLKNLEEQRNKKISSFNALITKFMHNLLINKLIKKIENNYKVKSMNSELFTSVNNQSLTSELYNQSLNNQSLNIQSMNNQLINENELLNKLENIKNKEREELEREVQCIKQEIKNILNFYKFNYKSVNLKYKYQSEELKKTKELESEVIKLREMNDKLTNEITAHKELIRDITIVANEIRKEDFTSTNEENVLNINLTNPHELFSCLIEMYIKNAPTFSNTVPLNEILSLGHLVYKIITDLSLRYKVGEMSYLNVFIYELNEKIIQYDLSLQNVTFFLSNLLELLCLLNSNSVNDALSDTLNDDIVLSDALNNNYNDRLNNTVNNSALNNSALNGNENDIALNEKINTGKSHIKTESLNTKKSNTSESLNTKTSVKTSVRSSVKSSVKTSVRSSVKSSVKISKDSKPIDTKTNKDNCLNNLTTFIGTLFQHMCELQKESVSHLIPDSIIYYQPLDKFKCNDNFFKKYFKSNHSVYKLINQLDYLCNMMYYFGIPSSYVKESLNYLLRSINVNCFNRLLVEQNFINFNRATQINFNLNELTKFCQDIGFTQGLDAFKHTKDVVVLVFLLENKEDPCSIQSECTSLNISQLNTFFAKIEGVTYELKNDSKEINIFLDDPLLNTPVLIDKHEFIFCLPRYLPSKQITALLSSI